MRNKDTLRADLEAAAGAGLIDAPQVEKLAAFLGERLAGAEGARLSASAATGSQAIVGEEDLRFVRNFHDVFLATGIVLLAFGLAISVGLASDQGGADNVWFTVGMLAAAGAAMWALGEVFSRKRRLFLPSIAICISFVLFVVAAAVGAYAGVIGERAGTVWDKIGEAEFVMRAAAPVTAGAGLLACLGFYARFRLPFSMGLSGVFGVLTMLGLVVVAAPGFIGESFPALILAGGIGVFLLGVWFDVRDPMRATRISDNGFWLHFGAAPMILHGVLNMSGGVYTFCDSYSLEVGSCKESSISAAIVALLVVLFLGLVSLLINRRALIVSALFTTGIAVAALMKAVGMDAGALAASTLVVLGGGVLILGAGWHSLRRFLLARVPANGFWAKVFPPEGLMADAGESAPKVAAN